MSRPFKPYMGKNTFGVFKESQYSSEYTLKKKALASFCPPNICVPSRTIMTQSNRLLLSLANTNYYNVCKQQINTANLNINLITKLNLNDVPVIEQVFPDYAVPAILDLNSVPYIDYVIDPSGNLFGNTICGTNNFQNYLQYNPPYETTNPDNINNL